MTFTPTSPTPIAPPDSSSYSRSDWLNGYQSQRQELCTWIAADCITGTMPTDLQGTVFRVGPGALDVAGHPIHHPFDGDGMVVALTLRAGQVHYQNRYVQTAGYLAEQQAGKPLYRGTFGTQKPGGWLANAFDTRMKNIANTNVVYWGDRLWALWEGDQPYRLDPYTLATIGIDDAWGLLEPGTPFSAHPRIDPHSDRGNGEPVYVTFSVKPGLSSTITLYELDRHGHCLHQVRHSIPGFAFLHDMAITPNYYIFFQNPIQFNPLPFLLGFKGAAQCIQFQPGQPAEIILIPRHGGDIRRIPTDPAFVFHHANAFETGDRLVLDAIMYSEFPNLDMDTSYRDVDFADYPIGQLRRLTVDLTASTVETADLVTRSCEFPVLHPDRVGQPYRYVFMGVTAAEQGSAPLQAYLKLDLTTGEQQSWSAAPRGFTGEPLFVPRPGAIAEDDGWLLGLVYDAAHHRSDLVILDAQHLAQGAIATVHLPHHIPYGLHGSFTEQVFLPPTAR